MIAIYLWEGFGIDLVSSLLPDYHIKRVVMEVKYMLASVKTTLKYRDKEIFRENI